MKRGCRVFLIGAAIGWVAAHGQGPYSKADSGWVPLFDGKTYAGLYIRTNGGVLQDPAVQNSFAIDEGSLHVSKTGSIGHIATRVVHSRYHVRVEYRYGKGQSNPNAGLLYHIDTGDYSPGSVTGSKNPSVPYLGGAYVKSVELQMYRGDAGAFLGIMNVWVTAETKGDGNHTWQAGGTPYTAVPSNGLAERRIYRSQNAAPNDTDWVRLEGIIHGADSVEHRVNGITVMKGKNLKHNRKTAISAAVDGEQGPMERGHIGLQAEGAEVFYRNWEIRQLRKDGTPIIPGCTNSGASNYLPIANEDDGSCKAVAIRRESRPYGGHANAHLGDHPQSRDALGRQQAWNPFTGNKKSTKKESARSTIR